MQTPAPPRPPIRPGLAILVAIFVGLFALLFGLGVLYDSEAHTAPIITLLVPLDLLIAPVVVGVRLRALGGWTALTGGAIASGTALFVCLPVALTMPPSIGAVVLGGALAAMVFAPPVIVSARTRRAAPLRRDR